MLLPLPVERFLAELAARTPTPGGGAASALAGAAGAALGAMCAAFSQGPKQSEAAAARARELHIRFEALREKLQHSIERDARAYQGWVEARKLPRESEAQQAARSARIAEAREEATAAPEEILAAAAEALSELRRLTPLCNPKLIADAAVAAYLLEAAAGGAAVQVLGNLAHAEDGAVAGRRARTKARWAACREAARVIEQSVLKALGAWDDTPSGALGSRDENAS